ncbi:MAG: hypothetical protein JWQ74_3576 [Marmoricola sp.]|nr:hypothetical protein [Marmoricola sp.]
MLKQILSPLTTATSVGVAIRYVVTIISSIIAILSILGWLTPEQVQEIARKVEQISGQVPGLIAAVAGLVALLTPIYAIMTKSSSDKAAEAAKQIDDRIPAGDTVHIPTPPGVPDIVVPPTPGAK